MKRVVQEGVSPPLLMIVILSSSEGERIKRVRLVNNSISARTLEERVGSGC
jgi:hypothetical protein